MRKNNYFKQKKVALRSDRIFTFVFVFQDRPPPAAPSYACPIEFIVDVFYCCCAQTQNF
jgi:hypothetical protein